LAYGIRTPIRFIRSNCCARTASGNIAATVLQADELAPPHCHSGIKTGHRTARSEQTERGRGLEANDVRFGSKADMAAHSSDVRFTPESGHSPAQSGCLLADIP
jgi:hypothetical protein